MYDFLQSNILLLKLRDKSSVLSLKNFYTNHILERFFSVTSFSKQIGKFVCSSIECIPSSMNSHNSLKSPFTEPDLQWCHYGFGQMPEKSVSAAGKCL